MGSACGGDRGSVRRGWQPDRTCVGEDGVESGGMSDDGAKLFAAAWSGSTLLEIDPTTGKALATLHLTTTYVLYRAQRR